MNRCVVCESTNVTTLLDMGVSPLANSFESTLEGAKASMKFGLALIMCDSCLYVRIRKVVDPSVLFRNNTYLTGVSQETRRDMEQFAVDCLETCQLPNGAVVLDVASNDGTLMSSFRDHGVRTIGVDPSIDACQLARNKGLEVIDDFFNESSALLVASKVGELNLITMTNVITHVPDPVELLRRAGGLLRQDGSIALEFYLFESIIENVAFDQIYHEHISYFNLHSFRALVGKAGLEVYKAKRTPAQGGSLRVFVARPGVQNIDGSVAEMLEAEGEHDEITARYRSFPIRVSALGAQIREHLSTEIDQGRIVAGYGASAKATVLLNYLSLNSSQIRAIGDQNPLKQGKYVPGTDIAVVEPKQLVALHPDVVVVFAWNIQREIAQFLHGAFGRAVDYLVLMPQVHSIQPEVRDDRAS
jgi:SAM-dependent methyltransferase